MSIDRNTQAARPGTIENRTCTGIRRIFQDHAIAGTHERFADEIESLLAAIGDEEVFVFGGNAIGA